MCSLTTLSREQSLQSTSSLHPGKMGGSLNFRRPWQSERLSSSKAVQAQGRAEKSKPKANSSHLPELSPDTHSHSGLISVVGYYTETSCATTHILIGSTFNTITTALVSALQRCLRGLHRSFQTLEGTGNITKTPWPL